MDRFFLFLGMFLIYFTLQAQNNIFFPTQKGTSLLYEYLDKKGEKMKNADGKERWFRYSVSDVRKNGPDYTIKAIVDGDFITEEMKKSKPQIEVNINKELLTIDNHKLMKAAFLSMMPDKVTIEKLSAVSSMPSTLMVGQILSDEKSIEADFKANAMGINLKISIVSESTNRKVLRMETVETPEGNIQAYLIVSDIQMIQKLPKLMGGQKKTKSSKKEWFSPELGIVKSETYNEKGELREIVRLKEISR